MKKSSDLSGTASQQTDNNFKIFVAGFPVKSSSKELFRYFDQFGGLKRIEVQKTHEHWISFSKGILRKGYCVIVVDSEEKYLNILRCQEKTYKDRKLVCKPFLKGKKLVINNQFLNNQRVILKHVSIDIPEKRIKTLLEKSFGPVDHLFPFKSSLEKESFYSRNSGRHNQKKSLVYSVKFSSLASAQAAVDRGSLDLSEPSQFEPLTIEPFINKNTSAKVPGSEAGNQLLGETSSSSSLKSERVSASQLHWSAKIPRNEGILQAQSSKLNHSDVQESGPNLGHSEHNYKRTPNRENGKRSKVKSPLKPVSRRSIFLKDKKQVIASEPTLISLSSHQKEVEESSIPLPRNKGPRYQKYSGRQINDGNPQPNRLIANSLLLKSPPEVQARTRPCFPLKEGTYTSLMSFATFDRYSYLDRTYHINSTNYLQEEDPEPQMVASSFEGDCLNNRLSSLKPEPDETKSINLQEIFEEKPKDSLKKNYQLQILRKKKSKNMNSDQIFSQSQKAGSSMLGRNLTLGSSFRNKKVFPRKIKRLSRSFEPKTSYFGGLLEGNILSEEVWLVHRHEKKPGTRIYKLIRSQNLYYNQVFHSTSFPANQSNRQILAGSSETPVQIDQKSIQENRLAFRISPTSF